MYDLRFLFLFLILVIVFTVLSAYFNRRSTRIKYTQTEELLKRQ